MPTLEVAGDDAWLDCLGVSPRTADVPGDEHVRELRIPVLDAEEVHITWDVTEDSVRVRLHRDGRIVCALFRELATLLTVAKAGLGAEISIEYGSDGWSGRTRIQVLPAVFIEDTVLRA